MCLKVTMNSNKELVVNSVAKNCQLTGDRKFVILTHTSHTQTTPETVYFKEFSSENSHAACAKPLATDKTLCK